MKARKMILLLTGVLLFMLIIASFLVSPYRYEYDVTLRQRDDDGVLVLKLFYFAIALFSVVGVSISFRLNKKLVFIFAGVCVYTLIRIASLLVAV